MKKILTLGIETSYDETAGNVTLHPVSASRLCDKFSVMTVLEN